MMNKLGYSWTSRRGVTQKVNLDAGAIAVGRSFTLAFVLDTADPSPSHGLFARGFADGVVRAAASHETASFDLCKKLCEEERNRRRGTYPGERFCFAMLHIDHVSHVAWALTIGDCRIGRHHGTCEADWLTPVHCAATLYGETFTREHLSHPDHRIVTRTVNPKRYAPESSGPFHGADGDWILATDGYWTREMSRHGNDAAPDDDCSVLILSQRSAERRVDSDVENFLYVSAA